MSRALVYMFRFGATPEDSSFGDAMTLGTEVPGALDQMRDRMHLLHMATIAIGDSGIEGANRQPFIQYQSLTDYLVQILREISDFEGTGSTQSK